MLTANFQMPEKIELDEASYSNTFGRFIIQPLERGFGVTLGNAFRRVLLSSLSGTAITAIKIDGVQHEFTSVGGVVEDVSDFVLNLKQVRLKQLNKKATKITIPLKGPKDFAAGDIQKYTTDFEVLNPEQRVH